MKILTLLIIGISLSIDAFTLSLAYGLLNLPKKTILTTSFSVGVFHFFMPIIGTKIGDIITNTIEIESKTILILVLVLIVIEMYKSLGEEKKEYQLTILNILLFSFLVSLDSLTIGIGIKYITNNLFLASLTFSLLSSIFTFMGFVLGKYLSQTAEKKAKYIAIALLLAIIMYLTCK